jgi:hypothetical protein
MSHPRPPRRPSTFVPFLLLLLAPAAVVAAPGPDEERFETTIRPLLAESCWSCHGPDKQFAGLRLDSREAMLAGGDSGPAVEPSKPEESLIVAAVSHAGDAPKMPPKRRLDASQVAALTDWVRAGAPWPAAAATAGGSAPKVKDHWAFRPVRVPAVPAVRDPSWVANPVDAFVLARLEAAGLSPSGPADRRTLLRRVTYDLTGLPPTVAEMDHFLTDNRADAYERVVDRLLASPRYGERWGRHWLDVARYADTKGYVFQEERRYPYAYTYRDWVIGAFNRDLPFDQFVLQQLAADRLDPERTGDDLAAMGFLTVGRRFLNKQEDIIDDRIDVTSRGFLGLTVACARCHDHKYDPIPTEDYYSLYGVFASSEEPADLPPLPGASGSSAYVAERAKRQAALDEFLAKRHGELAGELKARFGAYLLAAFDLGFDGRSAKLDERCKSENLRPELVRFVSFRWKPALAAAEKDPKAALNAWSRLAALPADDFRAKAAELAEAAPWGPNDPVAAALLGPEPPGSLREAAERLGGLLQKAAASETPELAPVRAWLASAEGPANLRPEDLRRILNRADRNAFRDRERKVAELDATHPEAPARAMVMVDRAQLYNPYVFQRGNPGRRGAEVPRRFLKVLSPAERTPFAEGSGRLELAKSIASPTNPLTARVLVNRVWMHHFGQGLVRTPSDFGLRSDPPSHPELLDWLATEFVRNGWSVKALHRTVLLSRTYQQASDDRTDARAKDPENLLLWRQNKRRLEFEPMRDSLLAAAGRLDASLGGRGVAITDPPFSTRRSVYAFIDRQNLDAVFRTFDLASPDASSPKRFETTVPQQALYMMNHPFVAEQARHLAARPEMQGAPDDAARVAWLYRRLFGREPEPAEAERGRRFLALPEATDDADEPGGWRQGWGGWAGGSAPVTFQPFPHWTGDAWQFGPRLPHVEKHYLHLTAKGGHVGSGPERAAIRRWVAPADGVIAISGTLAHRGQGGDGVRGRIVAGRGGLLGEWTAHDGQAAAEVARYEVRAGETIDFLADSITNDSFDGFQWAPTVRVIEPAGAAAVYAADAGFAGPPPPRMSRREQFVQVLLLTNEFAFVD